MGVIEPPWPPGEPEPPIFTDEWWALFKERVQQGWWAPFAGLILILSGAAETLMAILLTGILGQLVGYVGKMIMGAVSVAFMSGFHTLVKRSGKEATKWMTEAAETFLTPPSEWLPMISVWFSRTSGVHFEPNEFADLKIGPEYQKTVEKLGANLLGPMLGMIMPGAGTTAFPMGITPEMGMDAAERFLGANAQFQFSAWLLHMLGDVFSFGMWKAMKDLPNAISWSYGIGWLSWIVMGTPFRMGIAEPLEILYNRLYRPYKFNISQVAKMFWKQDKDITWFVEHMKDLGVKDQDMGLILDMECAKLSSAEVYSLYRQGKMSFDELKYWFKQQGHPIGASLILAADTSRREVRDLIGNVAKTAMKHYKDRRMSVAELKSFLREANWTDEEANLIVQDLNMQMALEKPEEVAERVLTPANIARLFQLGEKTRVWTEMMLTKRGFAVDEISDFLLLYKPKEEKEPEPKEPPAGLIGTLYKRGLISLGEAKARWADLDLTMDYIALLVMNYAPPVPAPPAPPREFSPSEIGRLYRDRYITREIALARLTAAPIHFTRENAVLFLDSFYALVVEVVPPPKEVPAAVVGGLYREGLVTLAVFRAYLVELRYSDRAVEWMLQSYAPPVPPPPPPAREFSPSEVGRLYRERKITKESALTRLTAPPIRLRRDDAVMYLDAFYAPVEEVVPPPKEAPASVVGGLYRSGLVTEKAFSDYLEELLYSDRAVTYLLQSYAPAVPLPPVPPREFTPSEIGKLWRDHYLTTENALARLTGAQIRMTTDDAQMYLDAFYQPVEIVEAPPKEAPASVVGSLYQKGMVALSDFEEYLDTLRYSETSKEFLVLEYQPPVPAPAPLPREFTPTEIGRLFSDVSITPRDAIDRLIGPQVRMTKEDAIIYLRSFYIPTSILDIGILYTIGTIGRIEAIRQLMTLLPKLLEVDAMYYLDTFFTY
jgi:hypothetical protein